MPEGAVYVGRGTAWGNPYRVGSDVLIASGTPQDPHRQVLERISAETAVSLYRLWVTHANVSDRPFTPQRLRWDLLRGKDLVCWCPLYAPCHADVLLDVSNRSDPR